MISDLNVTDLTEGVSPHNHSLGTLTVSSKKFISRSVAQFGRALSSGGRGREFKSRHSDQLNRIFLVHD